VCVWVFVSLSFSLLYLSFVELLSLSLSLSFFIVLICCVQVLLTPCMSMLRSAMFVCYACVWCLYLCVCVCMYHTQVSFVCLYVLYHTAPEGSCQFFGVCVVVSTSLHCFDMLCSSIVNSLYVCTAGAT
jgi:hypothetical protein